MTPANSMTRRVLFLGVLFFAASVYLSAAMKPEKVPLREPLSLLPSSLGSWSGKEAPPMTRDVLAVLGVDEYLNRYYTASGSDIVALYIGYYQSQREGDTIHSPLNCLPGAGWQPVETNRTSVVVPGRSEPITVNEVLIQKGLDRQIVLYWYQSHGRVVASEYWSKIFMVTDSIRLHRSDAALVRVVSPVMSGPDNVAAARLRASRFVQELFPRLERHLPS